MPATNAVDPYELDLQEPGALCSNCGDRAGDAGSERFWTLWDGRIYCPECDPQSDVANTFDVPSAPEGCRWRPSFDV